MPTLDISNLPCIKEKIDHLEALIQANDRLTTHSIVSATGCERGEATALLLMLYSEEFANAFLLIYHAAHPEAPFARRTFSEGIPQDEIIVCEECEELLTKDDLLYDLEFHLIRDVEFETKNPILVGE